MLLAERCTLWTLTAALAASTAHAGVPLGHIETRGTGPTPVVLIAGLACDWTVWDAFMSRNGDQFTMYAVTLPGMAGTQAPPKPATEGGTPWMDSTIESLTALIDEKQMKEPVIVGHSLGGHMALRLALDHPDKVGRVVMVDALPSFPVGGGSVVGEQRQAIIDGILTPNLRNQDTKQWTDSFAREGIMMVANADRGEQIRDMLKTTDGEVTVQYFIEGLRSDLAPRLGELKVPTLAIVAMNERLPAGMTPLQARAFWEETDAKSDQLEVVVFENTLHFVMDDRSAAFDAAVAAFSKGEPVQGVGPDAGPPDGVKALPKAGERPADRAPADEGGATNGEEQR